MNREIRQSKASELVDPVEWIKSNRILKGRPFNFQDREYLLPMYRDRHPRQIVVKARQMEMTERIVNWLLQRLTAHPHTTAIYTAPRQGQVSRFSRDRLRKAIKESPVLRGNLEAAREEEGKEAITRIPFDNGSICYLCSAWGAFDAIRNIPADFVAVDEFQDVQSEALPVIEETMSHSKCQEMLLVGTASDTGSEFDKLWQLSDMKEWNDEAQAWVPQKPENRMYSGYHLSQEMAPWIIGLPPEHPNSIAAKKARYTERRYHNEVLGLFYRGLAKPLVPEDLLACRDFKFSLIPRLDPPYVSYAGIDWGGGEYGTVIWIMAMDELYRWRLLYVHRFEEQDPMKQVRKIANLINLFNVKVAVADIGYGAVQVSELQKEFASRVLGCQYVRRPEIPLEQRHQDEEGRRVAQMILLADRSFWIETAIDHIKRKDLSGNPTPRLVLPWADPAELEWIIDQFTCIEMEEQESVSGRRYHHYTHPEGEPDHALHTFVYALIAYRSTGLSEPLEVMDLYEDK